MPVWKERLKNITTFCDGVAPQIHEKDCFPKYTGLTVEHIACASDCLLEQDQ